MRIMLAARIDHVLAAVYGFRVLIGVSLLGVGMDVASLHHDP